MKRSPKNLMKQCFLPRRTMAGMVAFLLAGNLSPFGMRALNYLNVEPLWSDIFLSIALFAVTVLIYCLIRPKYTSKN